LSLDIPIDVAARITQTFGLAPEGEPFVDRGGSLIGHYGAWFKCNGTTYVVNIYIQ